eukprot:15358989-Ditylum_brightwellii.AAC.2
MAHYKQFVSDCDPTYIGKGKEQALPSTAQLISACNFGKPDLDHQFSLEVVMEHIICPPIKTGFLMYNPLAA